MEAIYTCFLTFFLPCCRERRVTVWYIGGLFLLFSRGEIGRSHGSISYSAEEGDAVQGQERRRISTASTNSAPIAESTDEPG